MNWKLKVARFRLPELFSAERKVQQWLHQCIELEVKQNLEFRYFLSFLFFKTSHF